MATNKMRRKKRRSTRRGLQRDAEEISRTRKTRQQPRCRSRRRVGSRAQCDGVVGSWQLGRSLQVGICPRPPRCRLAQITHSRVCQARATFDGPAQRTLPVYTVCFGTTNDRQRRHYLQVTDEHYAVAVRAA